MIGTRLTTLLVESGYTVCHLSRSAGNGAIRTFLWDPYRRKIDKEALADTDAIIHLAGAGIADRRWNGKWKHEIQVSRTAPTRLLHNCLTAEEHHVKVFISASGINYYGLEDRAQPFAEHDPPGDDFMARVTVAWERETDQVADTGLRVAKIRTGVVLSRRGGALAKLAMPVKFLVGAPLGSGNQWVNWIHLEDLCGIYLRAIEDESMAGAYNAVSPQPVTNRTLTREIARVLKKPLWLPPVPGPLVRLIAGGVADVVLKGGKISSEKVRRTGFVFQHPALGEALSDLLL